MAAMATRVLVTLEPDADVERVVARLSELGGADIQPPQPELPDVCIASVDEQQAAPEDWTAEAARVPGVARAEVDRLRWSM